MLLGEGMYVVLEGTQLKFWYTAQGKLDSYRTNTHWGFLLFKVEMELAECQLTLQLQ